MNKVPFHGILAVGDTKKKAMSAYRSIALGQDVAIYRNEGSLSLATSVSSSQVTLFNPLTGNADMQRDDSLLAKVQFQSESSSDVATPSYKSCSGCSSHLVFDDARVVKYCPMCTCSLSGDDEQESETAEAGSADGNVDTALQILDAIPATTIGAGSSNADAAAAVTPETSAAKPAETAATATDGSELVVEETAAAKPAAETSESGEDDEDDEDLTLDGDDEDDTSESGDDEGDESGDEDDLSDLNEDDEDGDDDGEDPEDDGEDDTDDGDESESSDGGLVVADTTKAGAISRFLKESGESLSGGNEVEVEYLVCSSAECGAHIMHSTSSLESCPNCQSALCEPNEDETVGVVSIEGLQSQSSDEETAEDDFASESGDDEEDDIDLSDIEDDADADSDEDNSDDEGDGDTDDDTGDEDDSSESGETSESSTMKTAIASTAKAALARFQEINADAFKSVSSDGSADVEVHAKVCTGPNCGLHSVSATEDLHCSICGSDNKDESDEEVAQIMGELGVAKTDEGEEDNTDLEDPSDADTGEDEGSGEEGSGESEEAEPADEDEDKTAAEQEGDDESSEENEETSESSEMVQVSALDTIDDTVADAHKQLDVSVSAVQGKPQWTAFFNGVPVAIATAADVGENTDIFDKPAFGLAVTASAPHIGVKKALAEMGFKSLVSNISMSSVVAKQVESQVAEQRAALASAQQETEQRFMSALATAAIGINRGFFKDLTNPMRAALCSAMETAGMRNPEVVVDNVFRTTFEPFQKIAHAKAQDILSKPLDVQQALSAAVLETAFQSNSSGAPNSQLESRVSGLGTSVSSAASETNPKKNAQASSTSSAAPVADPSFEKSMHVALFSFGRPQR